MSDSFQVEPIGKSWADIVEEEEEYNRLHPDGEVKLEAEAKDSSDQLITTATTPDTIKSKEEETKQQPVVHEKIKESETEKQEGIIAPVQEETKVEAVEEKSVKEEPVQEVLAKQESSKEEPVNEEHMKEEPAKPVVTGAKASRWASATDEAPKTSRREKLDTNRDNPSSKFGAMASKWASSSYGNRSRYDHHYENNNRGRYNDRYNNNYDAPTSGRLNRSTFEDKLNRSTFESKLNRADFEPVQRRNHYDKDFDSDDRNGGFDNKDNFRHNRKFVEPENEEAAQAIKNWNSYKPPADENDIKKKEEKEQTLPVLEKKPVEKKEEKIPLEDIANFKPASFSWADDIDNSSDDDEEVESVAPEPVPKDDHVAPEPIAKDECYKVNIAEVPEAQNSEEKPLPPVYTWRSLEEAEAVKKEVPVNETPSWGALNSAVTPPAVTEKPAIKDSWKNKIPVVEQDNASAWKTFAETIAVPPPAPIVKSEEKKKKSDDISSSTPWDPVQQSTSWNSSSATQEESKGWNSVQEISQPTTQPPQQPQEVSLKLSDFSSNTTNFENSISTNNSTPPPATASFKLSDFTNTASNGSTATTKRLPETISLKLTDFAGSSTSSSPKPLSLRLHDSPRTSPQISLRLSDFNIDKQPKQPHTVSLKLGDLGIVKGSPPPSNSPSLKLSGFNETKNIPSLKLSDFEQPPVAQQLQQSQQADDSWKIASASWNNNTTTTNLDTTTTTNTDSFGQENSPSLGERHPETWGETVKTSLHIDTKIVESSERPRRKLQMAGGQWNALQKNLMGNK